MPYIIQIFCLDNCLPRTGTRKKGQKTQKKLEFRLKNKENRQKAGLKPCFRALIGTNRDESAFLGRRAGRRVSVSKSGLSRRDRDGWQVWVRQLLKALDLSKAAGPNEIPPAALKMVADEIAFPISILFNESLATGVLPDEFKIGHLHPLLKPGKSNSKKHQIIAESRFSQNVATNIGQIFRSLVLENTLTKGYLV